MKVNMKNACAKLDKVERGGSKVKEISKNEYRVEFVDFLMHKNIFHTYRCARRLHFDRKGKIEKIGHISHPEEERLFLDFYRNVGLALSLIVALSINWY
jgi:hypothetical protein